uniref:Uncharacterized protein n=1 Tax=Cacopsylla melanoneura TaxID=428564 RepID=A0A8D9C2X9_9HEMI
MVVSYYLFIVSYIISHFNLNIRFVETQIVICYDIHLKLNSLTFAFISCAVSLFTFSRKVFDAILFEIQELVECFNDIDLNHNNKYHVLALVMNKMNRIGSDRVI